MSLKRPASEMTVEDGGSCTGGRERLGMTFTIDYLLFNKGGKDPKGELVENNTPSQIASNKPDTLSPEGEEEIISEMMEKGPQRSNGESDAQKAEEEQEEDEGEDEEEGVEGVDVVRTTTSSAERPQDKPTHSYIALISMAIMASEEKKLLLCDIYQWIMDHYPYFRSEDKNWRNSVRHNLSLNDCFVKASRSENGKGHFWAVHPSNYQDFSRGDYHCRRARRRVRKPAGQHPFLRLGSPYYAAVHGSRDTACWCCRPTSGHPLACLPARFYWGWASVASRTGRYHHLNAPRQ